MKSKRYIGAFFCLLLWVTGQLKAQPCTTGNYIAGHPKPTKCFEIVSILVDACDGSLEGQNEMVRFIVGNKTLVPGQFSVPDYVSGMVNWGYGAQNPFRGFSDGSSSLFSKINTINKLIKDAGNCGNLIFVSSMGRIPPYSQGLIITSESFNALAQDFSDLQDTLYVIVQKSGNTAGHFVNYGASAQRTLILTYGSNCSDTVAYDRSKLVKIGGGTGAEDGAVVNFEYDGKATYVNYGCRVPSPKIGVHILNPLLPPCGSKSYSLYGVVNGSGCYEWQLESSTYGYFDDPKKLNTTLHVKSTYTGKLRVFLKAWGTCSKPVTDTLILDIPLLAQADFDIDSSAAPTYCFTRKDINATAWRWGLDLNADITRSAGKLKPDTITNAKTICSTYAEGKHWVCLEVTGANGCKDTLCKEFEFKTKPPIPTEPFLEIANVFTPAEPKDGFNDEWRFHGWGVESFHVRVYSRWGTLVYESKDVNERWNGREMNKGVELPGGSYFYHLQYSLNNQSGELKIIQGVVTLIR